MDITTILVAVIVVTLIAIVRNINSVPSVTKKESI